MASIYKVIETNQGIERTKTFLVRPKHSLELSSAEAQGL